MNRLKELHTYSTVQYVVQVVDLAEDGGPDTAPPRVEGTCGSNVVETALNYP